MFFLERISALFEDRSVHINRFISRSYEFYEPVDGELARLPIRVERAAKGSLCPLRGVGSWIDPGTRGRNEEFKHADIEPVGEKKPEENCQEI